MSDTPRVRSHGEQMGADTTMGAEDYARVHCCACWRYTDDMTERRDLVHEAVAVVVNGGTLCVENSDAFKAADAYLASQFKAATRTAGMPRLS